MKEKSVWQRLYDSEINFNVSTFWDGGFDWKLGDALNGIKAAGCSNSFAEAGREIEAAALKHFPQSVFATGTGMVIPEDEEPELGPLWISGVPSEDEVNPEYTGWPAAWPPLVDANELFTFNDLGRVELLPHRRLAPESNP